MPSASHHLLVSLLRLARVRNRVFDPDRFTGRTVERQARRHRPPARLARRVTITHRLVEGWPTYTLTPRDGGPSSGHLLLLHGGAYAAQIQPGHWTLAARLAEQTRRTVTVPIYPLVPAATHREILPVLARLYEQLTRDAPGPAGVAVLGDSAGGGMALALVQSLPRESRPADLILLSPWLDATLGDPRVPQLSAHDPLLHPPHLRRLAQMYAGGDDLAHPAVSPINGPLDALGRVHVFTGTRDVLNVDAHRLRQSATEHDIDLTFHETADMIHDWMLMPVPEARTVRAQIAAML